MKTPTIALITLSASSRFAAPMADEPKVHTQAGLLHTLSRWAMGAGLTALSACTAVGPDYQTPRLDLPAQWSGAGPAQAAAKPPGATPQSGWWSRLNDALLDKWMAQALAHNPDTESMQARLRQARAQSVVITAGSGPSLSTSAKIANDRMAKNSENFANIPFANPKVDFTNHVLGFDASWEIDFWGRQERLREGAQARIEGLQWRLEDSRLQVSAEVARWTLEWRAGHLRRINAQALWTLQQDSLTLIEKRRAWGDASENEVLQARSAVWSQQSALEQAQQNERMALISLSALTAWPVQALQSMAEASPSATELPLLPGAPELPTPATLVHQRADVRASERELAAASADVGVAVSDLYPRFSLFGTGGWTSVQASNWFEPASRTWSTGLQLWLPLFNQGRLRAQAQAQQSAFEVALAQYRKSVLNALADVEGQVTRLSHSARMVAQQEQILQTRSRQQELLQLQQRAGDASQLQVLEARRAALLAREQLVSAQAQSLLAYVALHKALGGAMEPPAHTQP